MIPDGAIDDLVLLRSDGSATYNFATAVDDAQMDITHVIRGEDHIANTASQLAILRALGRREPRYAHCALLLDEHGHKLSKRSGAESIADLRADGYPPEAIVNYVALLVCPAPEGVDEVASLRALASRFSLSIAVVRPAALRPRQARLPLAAPARAPRPARPRIARRPGARAARRRASTRRS